MEEREMTSETDENGQVFSDEEVSGKGGGLPREDSSFFDDTEDWTEHGDAEEVPPYSHNTSDEPAISPPPRSTQQPSPRPSPRNPIPSQQRSRTALQVMLSWNFWVDGWLRWLLVHWSKVVVRFPVLLCLLALLICAGLGAGMLLREDGGDDASLWLSDGNKYSANEAVWKQEFREHEDRIIITPKKPKLYGSNLLNNTLINATGSDGRVVQTSYLKEVYAFHTFLFQRMVTSKGPTGASSKNYTLSDLCVHTDGNVCAFYTVLDYWHWNETAMLRDPSPAKTVSRMGVTAFMQPLLNGTVIGGIDAINGTVITASAFRSIFFTNSSPYLSAQALNALNAWEDSLGSALSYFQDRSPLINVNYIIQASSEELLKEAQQDEPYLYVGLSLMWIFLATFLFSFDCIISKVLLTCSGAIHVVAACVASTGVCGFLSVISTPLSPTLYVMIAAIGINHILLLVHAFERALARSEQEKPHSSKSANLTRADERAWVSSAMAESLPSITVECVAAIAAFVAISISSDPGFRAFGQQAALAMLTEYLLLVSFFSSCLVLDSRRIRSYRSDILPCLSCVPDIDDSSDGEKSPILPRRDGNEGPENDGDDAAAEHSSINSPRAKEEPPSMMAMITGATGERGSLLLPLIKRVYSPALLYPPVKVICVLCLLGLLGVSIYGLNSYEQQFERADLYSSDSSPHAYLGLEEDMFPQGTPPITVVNQAIAYPDPTVGGSLLQMIQDVRKNRFIVPDSFHTWYEEFLSFLQRTPPYNSTLLPNGFPPKDKFYPYLNDFLLTPSGSFFCGDLRSALPSSARFGDTPPSYLSGASMMTCHRNFSSTNPIIASRFRPINVPLPTLADEVDSIEGLYDTVTRWGVSGFPFGQNYAFYMTFPEMEASWKMYLILAFAVVFIVTFVGIDVISCLAVMMVFSMVYVALIGIVMHFSVPSIPISQLSLAAIIVTTALSVNYSIHIAHEFMIVRGTRKERMAKTLGSIGYSITAGFLCTFLGSFVGLLVESTIYRTFVIMFISTQVLSWGHALIFIPAMLSIFGVDNPR